MSDLRISVVICTYNRAKYLPMALDSLLSQTLSPELFEVLVVDNNSTDDTRSVVDGYMSRMHNLRYVVEERQGLSHARNRGVAETQTEWILYVDDDCEMDAAWLERYLKVLQKVSDVLVIGGPVYPYYISHRPAWYRDRYGTRFFGEVARFLNAGEYLIGCNFGCHRNAFELSGLFDPQFGMTGNRIGYSEETEWQMRLRSEVDAEAIFYHPDLGVKHLIRPEKLTLRWILRSYWAKGKSNWSMKLNSRRPAVRNSKVVLVFSICKTMGELAAHLIYGLAFRNRTKYPHINNYIVERMQWHVKKLSYLSIQCSND